MNVIISNKLRNELKNISIPIGKELIGTYSIDDIVNSFANFTFTKLIIDLSAIKDQENLLGFQRLSSTLNVNDVIFVINDSNDNKLISNIIPFGIYNFANTVESVIKLTQTSNQYKDVAHYHDLSNSSINKSVTMGITGKTRIIGYVNMTKEAGSTSLIYMSMKYLSKFYKVLGLEINKNDFKAFNQENLKSISTDDFVNELNKSTDYDIILVDLNDSKLDVHCSDVLYLIEPSIIKIDMLSRLNGNFSEFLRGKKVILNKSFLTSDDLSNFEYEGKLKVYFNLPPINDRANKSEHIISLYKKLGMDKKNAKRIHKNK